MVKILVIENEALVLENIQEILEFEDFETIAATDGFVGLRLAKEQLPDLIICDIMMPRLDGYGVLAALRQHSATANIPLIFLTAKADRSDMRQGMDLGADDYLTKPFTPAELRQAVAARLEKQASMVQQYSREYERSEELQRIAYLRGELLKKLIQDLRDPLSNINVAIQLLKNAATPAECDRYIQILQNECAREIALLNEVTEMHELLSPGKIKLLQQFNLLKQTLNRTTDAPS